MADRSVAITLKANVQGLVAGFKTAQTAASDFAAKGLDKVAKNEQHINTLSNGIGALGLAMVGMAAVAVNSFADFDQAMSGVAATGDDARGSLDALRQAAIDAGADTQYSATEAARGIEEMAKAGVSATDILGGGLTGALNLAASGQIEVGEAAGIASTLMNQFGLKGKDVGRIADVLAASAGKANGEVADFGLAMKYVGPVAAQLGVSLEETSGTLALLAQNGILADSAGTGLRGVLMSLTAPSKEAQKALDEYNISAFDAQGKFVGLTALVGQLEQNLGGLTEAERSAALGRMFGNEQITAARILYNEGAGAVQEWTAAVDDQGFAAEQARIKTDNLRGDLERLGGAFDTVLIQSGSGANNVLREMAQGAEALVGKIGEIPDPVLGATSIIAGAGGMAALGIAAMGKLVIGISDARDAFKNLGVGAKAAGGLVAGVGSALTIATVGLTIWATENAKAAAKVDELASSLDAVTGEITGNTREIVKNDLAAKGGWWIFDKQYSANSAAKLLGIDLDVLTDAALGNAKAMETVSDAVHQTDGGMNDLTAAAEAAGVGLGDYVAAQGIVEDAVKGTNSSLDEAIEIARQKQEADAGQVDAQGELAGALGETTDAVVEQTDMLEENIDAQAEAAGIVLSQRDAQRNLEQSVADASAALEANGQTLDITTEKGRANQSALDDISQSSWDLIEAMKANGSSQEEIQGVMQTSRDKFLGAATSMGMSADEANRLADELGLIPANVTTAVTAHTADAIQNVSALSDSLDNLPKSINIPVNITGDRPMARGQGGAGGMTFADGGYTGDGGKYQPAGIVHRGEFVMDAQRTAMWRPLLEAIHQDRYVPGFASGGYVGAPSTPAPAARHTELHVHNEGKRDVTTQDLVFAQARLEALAPAWY